jgi:hypothetical protein
MSILAASSPKELMIVFGAIVLLTTVPTGLVYWYKTKRAAMDADLKMKMLEMGMSADEIERVLAAESSTDGDPKRKSR